MNRSKRILGFSYPKNETVQNASKSPGLIETDTNTNRAVIHTKENNYQISENESKSSSCLGETAKCIPIKKSQISRFNTSRSSSSKISALVISSPINFVSPDRKFEKLMLPTICYSVKNNHGNSEDKSNRKVNTRNIYSNKNFSNISCDSRHSSNKLLSKISITDEAINKEIDDLNAMMADLLGEEFEKIDAEIVKSNTVKRKLNLKETDKSLRGNLPTTKPTNNLSADLKCQPVHSEHTKIKSILTLDLNKQKVDENKKIFPETPSKINISKTDTPYAESRVNILLKRI